LNKRYLNDISKHQFLGKSVVLRFHPFFTGRIGCIAEPKAFYKIFT